MAIGSASIAATTTILEGRPGHSSAGNTTCFLFALVARNPEPPPAFEALNDADHLDGRTECNRCKQIRT